MLMILEINSSTCLHGSKPECSGVLEVKALVM